MSTSAISAPTDVVAAGFSIFENMNWSELGAVIKAKGANVAQDVTTAEDIAGVLVSSATVAGVPFAGDAAALLPAAESLINVVLKLTGAGAAAAKS